MLSVVCMHERERESVCVYVEEVSVLNGVCWACESKQGGKRVSEENSWLPEG
jgi:hypothetical protein